MRGKKSWRSIVVKDVLQDLLMNLYGISIQAVFDLRFKSNTIHCHVQKKGSTGTLVSKTSISFPVEPETVE